MVMAFVCGNEIATKKDIINPNLLNSSAGIFQVNSSHTNYKIFDKANAYLEKGKIYCLSLKTDGTFLGREFEPGDKIGCFEIYLYASDNAYNRLQGKIVNNSLTFAIGKNDTFRLCVQEYGHPTNPPKIWQVKIEEGSSATAWMPSSNDLANLLQTKMGGN